MDYISKGNTEIDLSMKRGHVYVQNIQNLDATNNLKVNSEFY
jgi:hypothetical protein